MPYIKTYIHFVWSTKNRFPFLDSKEVRQKVWHHIKENAKEKGIFIDFVNGYTDHCHCLVSLGADQTIQKTMQLIKGESSFWINKNKLCLDKFEWQDEYFAVSVSESMIDKVRNYIRNQEEHHRKQSFQEEYDEFMAKYKFQKE
jgi:REP element-mobilizing transposase RayT